MNKGLFKALAAMMLLAWASLPGTAHAEHPLRASCLAGTELGGGVDFPTLPPTSEWRCDETRFVGSPPVSWIFFTPDDFSAGSEPPSHFVTDVGMFDRLTLIAMGPDGPVRSRGYAADEVTHFVNGPKFALPLPDMRGATGLVVAIEHPYSPALTAQAVLQSRHGPSDVLGWTQGMMLAIALMLGMMATPLAYHAAFHRILRQNFVSWQMATLAALIGFVIVSSGLVHYIFTISMQTTLLLLDATILSAGCCALGFALSYLEPGMVGARTRRIMWWSAGATTCLALLAALPIAMVQSFYKTVLLLAPLPLLTAIFAVLAIALHAGSSAARIMLGCWATLALAGCLLALRCAGMPIGTTLAGQLMYGAIALHVVFAACAVVQRVDIIRRDRERVNARLDALTNLIDLDPLTGIFNRRALEKRFTELRSDGFHALGVIDLDHFKGVNDRFGHTTGDRVLQEVAAVLSGDSDAIGFRMGGEEFVVMLRGGQVQQRAEQLRRAITIRIANEIEGIDTPVTASMGLIESPPGGASTMRQLYSQADRLLYEAKHSGRNRLISERIQLFEPPRRDRRKRDRRTA